MTRPEVEYITQQGVSFRVDHRDRALELAVNGAEPGEHPTVTVHRAAEFLAYLCAEPETVGV